MTFFAEEHELFRKTLRDFVATELAPHARKWDEARSFPRSVFERCGELGFLGAHYPTDVGGAGGDWWYAVVWGEELVRANCMGVSTALSVQSDMATPILLELGSREQKDEFLAPALRGEKIAALGVSEAACGSDVAALRTTAVKVGDEYVIDGSKCWITNGARADFITLAARTGRAGHDGISLFTFPTDCKGFSVTRTIEKMGHHASDTAELSFEACRIPARYLLGDENRGFQHIMTGFQGERLLTAVESVAGAQWALDQTLRYAQERSVFGQPVLKFQVWRHTFADLQTQIEAGRWLTYRAVDQFISQRDATTEITMAKLFCTELINKVVDRCVQAHGGCGYSDEFPISRLFRDARLLTIGGGTSEVMREILSKRLGWG